MNLLIALFGALIANSPQGEMSQVTSFSIVAIPLFQLISCAVLARRTLAKNKRMIWTASLLFLFHTGLFRGVGPLVRHFGNDATKAFVKSGTWGATDLEFLRVQVLNATATAVVLLTLSIALSYTRPLARSSSASVSIDLNKSGNPRSAQRIALIFLFFGLVNKYLILLPYQFDLTQRVPPGILSVLGPMVNLGFALIAFIAVKSRGNWVWIFWLLFIPHIAISMLEFKKSVVMLALLLPAFTTFLAHGKLHRLVSWLASGLIIFMLLQPLNTYARSQIMDLSGNINNASVAERIDIMRFALKNYWRATEPKESDVQIGWTRLDYSGQQAWVMRDESVTGANDTLSTIFVRLIPRALWPEKPVGLGPGKGFYERATGHAREVRVGITHYADMYWNAGWIGVILYGVILGSFLAIMSQLTLRWLSEEKFLMFPVILLVGDFTLRSLNGWVSNNVTLIPYILVYTILIKMITRALVRFKAPRRIHQTVRNCQQD